MSDKEESQLKDTELFYGATCQGISYAEFDELMRDWGSSDMETRPQLGFGRIHILISLP